MKIDDHNELCGGVLNALTIWLSDEDLEKLKSGKFVQAKNEKRGVQIILLVNDKESR